MNKKQFESAFKLLKVLPHKKQVEFALYCAKDVWHLVEDKKTSAECLDPVKKWLKDDTSVTINELRTAAAKASTIYTFFNVAATTVANTVEAAANAANAAANAATAAVAAHSVSTFAVDQYKAFDKYYKKLLEMADLDDLEKILYIEMDI